MVVWIAVMLGAVAVALVAQFVVFAVVLRAVRNRPLATQATQRLRGPTQVLVAALVVGSAKASSPLSAAARSRGERAVGIVVVCGIAWLLTRMVGVLVTEATRRLRIDVPDNFRARSMQTQLTILQRVVTALIAMLAMASILWSFGEVRALGASLLASAGIVGIVAGVAARSTLANVFAGIQIAFSAPIRIDDVVVVDGQWGRVEEITLAHVIVRTWDERRLVLPCLYFLEHPFQNWTRRSSDIMGTVFLYVDYTVPVEEIRQELQRIVQSSDLWDGRVCGLQVTNTTDKSMELRCLVSSADSGKSFDLRALVRERLIGYIQKHHPESLPQVRAVLANVGTAGGEESGALARGAPDGNEGRAA